MGFPFFRCPWLRGAHAAGSVLEASVGRFRGGDIRDKASARPVEDMAGMSQARETPAAKAR